MSHSNYTDPTENQGERTLGKPVSRNTQKVYETPELARRAIVRDINTGTFLKGLGCILQGIAVGVATYAITKDPEATALAGAAFGGGAAFRDAGKYFQNEAFHKETKNELRKI